MNPPPYLEDILRLSVEDRLRLVTWIWETIAAENPPLDLTDAEWAEIRRRIDNYRRDPSRGIPAEEFFLALGEMYDE
ncbi:MAG TPA: addiction module protein [Longimicrobium sp.]|nr:addiction module protein [Longimicrobium sp.]